MSPRIAPLPSMIRHGCSPVAVTRMNPNRNAVMAPSDHAKPDSPIMKPRRFFGVNSVSRDVAIG
ncbi:hypothetical protein [Microbacterium sp. PI-1]|uniref:hypothetical protein n=1 Tax=Microbacterium sp. PI-1 TaxID=2545631 RepID=UPI0023EA562A|nr:hypothetical protein [Microbacterium sp. PI-1]